MKIRRRSFGALAIGALLLSGMLGPGALAQDSTPADQESFPVNIRFLNAMTSLDKVDVYINGDESDQRVIEGLEYGVTSDVVEGTAPVTGILIKQNVEFGVDQYLYNIIVNTEAGKEYLVVISDLLIIPTEFDQSRLGPGEARARAINAAAQAPALDFYASEAGGGVALLDLVPVVNNLRYGEAGDGGVVPAGSYDVIATATGTDSVVVEAPATALDAGQVYTVVVIGKPGDTENPLTLVTVSVPAN